MDIESGAVCGGATRKIDQKAIALPTLYSPNHARIMSYGYPPMYLPKTDRWSRVRSLVSYWVVSTNTMRTHNFCSRPPGQDLVLWNWVWGTLRRPDIHGPQLRSLTGYEEG